MAATGIAAWGFLIASENAMDTMRGDGLAGRLMLYMMAPEVGSSYIAAAALMWLAMMLAMMMPAAAPVTTVFMRMGGERSALGVGHAASFVVGYFVAWIGFGIVAAIFQRSLHSAGLFETHMLNLQALLAGAILVGAGLYQLTPLKDVCLAHCRTPMGFLLGHWRDGRWGALRMGTEHGMYCLGCCWALMLLMFAGGMMSVIVMALISVFILLERLLPDGPWVTKLPGLAMIAGGIYLIAGG